MGGRRVYLWLGPSVVTAALMAGACQGGSKPNAAAPNSTRSVGSTVVSSVPSITATSPRSATWVPMTIGAGTQMVSVSCSSPTFCVALGLPPASGNPPVPSCQCSTAFTYSNGKWSSGVIVDRHTYQDSISCPTPNFCLAVDSLPGISPEGYQGGYAFTYEDGIWSAPRRIEPGSLMSVSCSSVSFCVAADVNGVVYTYRDKQWSSGSKLPGATGVDVYSVSCTTSEFCMAVGLAGEDFGLGWYSKYTNGQWSPGSTFKLAPNSFLQGVSCASTTLCVAVDQSGDSYVYTGHWEAGQKITSVTETPSVSCPSESSCFATGDHDVNTLTGGRWNGDRPLSGLDLRALSCTSTSFCAAVGASFGNQPNGYLYNS